MPKRFVIWCLALEICLIIGACVIENFHQGGSIKYKAV
jgi:hypothetical protein